MPNILITPIFTRLIGIIILSGTASKLYPYNKKLENIILFTIFTIICILSPIHFMYMAYEILVLSSKALSSVKASIYSMSTPIGTP